MAPLDIYFRSDLRGVLLAGLVLCVRTAQATGANLEFLRGALVAYQHQALAFQIGWPSLLASARAALGDGIGALLDAAVTPVLEVSNANKI